MLNGIDIASYQKSIVPAKLTSTDFVIVKFTQGTDYINPYANQQYSGAKSAKKLLGAYHYAEGGDPKKEAAYFVKTVGDRIGECILALDWEGTQNPTFGTGKDVTWCKAWLDEVYRLTGVRPLIYMSKSVCRKWNWKSVAVSYKLWCAQYASNALTNYQSSPWTDGAGWGAWAKDTIRQYSSHGRIKGYNDNIDIDRAYLTAAEWKALAKPAKKKEAPTQENPIDVMINIMKGEVGYHEGAHNHTKYGDEMHKIQPSNMDANAPWCDAWFDWCVLQTCKHFGKGVETAKKVLCGDFDDYTYNSVNLYKKAGRWTQTPHKGDQIFFGGSGHTGGVIDVRGGIVHTIEGNKGDEVRNCSYSVHSPTIIGYGRPRYYLITGKQTAADMPLLKRGAKGEDVKTLQRLLIKAGYSCGKCGVDGSLGKDTEKAVKDYQRDHKLEVDGEVGPITWGSLK